MRRSMMTPLRLVGSSTRFARRMVLLPMVAVVLAVVADAFFVSSSSRAARTSTTCSTPTLLPAAWRPPPATSSSSSSSSSLRMAVSMSGGSSTSTTGTTATAVVPVPPEVALDPIISDLRARIQGAPSPLEGNEESRVHAEETLSTIFRVDQDGNLVGGFDQQVQLARALALNTFVVVRIEPGAARECLQRLGGAAEYLLGESRTVEEKMNDFGQMQNYDEGVVSGYAGGGDYGSDQFLETRGGGGDEIFPKIADDVAPDVIEGRRALAAISNGVLQTVVSQSLPEVRPAAFLDLVDGGEGNEEAQGPRKMSSTPLRMCRYAGGADGVAFGAHTDTTFLTVIPCASAPGLEILQPSTGRWVRPEAARNCRAGSDIMLLAGELLQVFGRGRYQAAVHRVVRPAGLVEPRVSTPLLVRGAAGVTIRDYMLPASITTRLSGKHSSGGGGGGGARQPGAGAGAEADLARRDGGAALRQQSSSLTPTPDAGEGQLTMTDVWAALQFRGGGSSSPSEGGGNGGLERGGDESGVVDAVGEREPDSDVMSSSTAAAAAAVAATPPLAQAKTEEQIRRRFAPFAPGGVTVLSVDPLLVRLHGFASPEECATIIDLGSGNLIESTTWGGSDAQAETDEQRTSATTWLKDDELAPLLESLTDRVCGMSRLPSAFMEKWQVARYKPRGYFKLHTDHVEAFNDLACGGRLGTLIVYLNDDFTGGQTQFPYLEVTVQPSAGDAIYFHSVRLPVEQEDADAMRVDGRVAHSGLPVEQGNKWIATKWIHPLPYPHGNNDDDEEEEEEADEPSPTSSAAPLSAV